MMAAPSGAAIVIVDLSVLAHTLVEVGGIEPPSVVVPLGLLRVQLDLVVSHPQRSLERAAAGLSRLSVS